MNSLERYAEAVRSGRHETSGLVGAQNLTPIEEPMKTPTHMYFLYVMSAILLIYSAIITYEHMETKPTVQNLQEDFMNWAYAASTGLGLDCKSMTVKSGRQLVLHSCFFTTRASREKTVQLTHL